MALSSEVKSVLIFVKSLFICSEIQIKLKKNVVRLGAGDSTSINPTLFTINIEGKRKFIMSALV